MKRVIRETEKAFNDLKQSFATRRAALEAEKNKTERRLQQVQEERQAVMKTGDREKARRMKAQEIDLESDLETVAVMIEQLDEDRRAALKSLADRQTPKLQEAREKRHQRDRQHFIELAEDILKTVEEANGEIDRGNKLIEALYTEAGETAPKQKQNYINIMDGRRLIMQLNHVAQQVHMCATGETPAEYL